VIYPTIERHGGKIVQTGGDSLLIVFDSIDGAVRCAVEVQKQVPFHDADQPLDRAIRFRIGINLGDAIADGTDLHGDAVNVVARLQTECPPGSICVSRSVHDHVHGRLGLQFEQLGVLTLKNISRPVEAFVVRIAGPSAAPTPVVKDIDFGIQPVSDLHTDLVARTPLEVPGAKTIRTPGLTTLLSQTKPLLIDVALDSWGYSLPGAVGLQGIGHGAAFSEGVQARFARKTHGLTGGDLTTPIVVFCVNSERFTGYNAALRLTALGCTDVHWYRGGVEAWEVNGLPASELVLQAW
jgi:rhodanese-related sulfurtransferase